MENTKEIKKRIKLLRKIKKDTRIGTQQRRDLNKRIRELKEKLVDTYGNITPEKKELIKEIYKLRPELKQLRNFDLKKFSVEELRKHIELTKKKRNR